MPLHVNAFALTGAMIAVIATASCPFGLCAPCGFDAVCVHDVDEGDHCAPPAGRGEVCKRRSDTPPDGELDHACEPELECVLAGGSFVPVSLCVPSEGPRLLGEPCTDAPCAEELECVTQFEGFALCERGVGSECTFSEECASRACGAEQRCVTTDCAADDDCSPGEVCAGSECGARCEPPATTGEPCFSPSEVVERCDETKHCAAGLTCASDPAIRDNGVCQPL